MTRKNTIAPSAAYTRRVIAFAALKLRERNMLSGIIGCSVRCSTTRNATPATIPMTSAAGASDVRPLDQPVGEAAEEQRGQRRARHVEAGLRSALAVSGTYLQRDQRP